MSFVPNALLSSLLSQAIDNPMNHGLIFYMGTNVPFDWTIASWFNAVEPSVSALNDIACKHKTAGKVKSRHLPMRRIAEHCRSSDVHLCRGISKDET